MSKLLKNSIIKQIFSVLFVALIPLAVSATELGKLNVFSALGEPLNAEVELLSVTPEEMATLRADLASQEQYLSQGINKPAIQQNIKTSISQKPNGSIVILLSSSQGVTDPFLDMLIQVVWDGGQLSREYTLLLDPSDYSTADVTNPVIETPKSIVDQSIAKESTVSSSAVDSKRKSRKSINRDNPQAKKDEKLDVQSITTAKGDTLTAIVGRIHLQNVSQDINLDQLLLGIYQANPSAFVDGNMNRLKIGQVINIPGAEILQAINKSEAQKEVHAQVSNWHAYVTKLSEAASHSGAAGNSLGQQNGGKIVTKAEDKSAPVAEESRDVVKLAKTDLVNQSNVANADLMASSKASAQSVTNMQDDLAAKENANKETDEKSAALEKQISDMKQLLAIKNKNMADAQKNAESAQTSSIQSPRDLLNLDPVVLGACGALVTLLFALWWANRRKNKLSLLSDVDPIKNADLIASPIDLAAATDQASPSVGEIGIEIPETRDHVTEHDKLESSAKKPLEMDLTEISLDFDATPQLATLDVEAAPIPDAFNGDFSNILKMNVKPQRVKSSLKATTSKAVTKKSKMSNDESADIATKLELASAYIDMQDKEGALELLAEAIREGGPDQRKRAQALIDNLS